MSNNRDSAHHKARRATFHKRQLGIRLPTALNDRLAEIARSESNNVSSVVRRLLTIALKDAGARP